MDEQDNLENLRRADLIARAAADTVLHLCQKQAITDSPVDAAKLLMLTLDILVAHCMENALPQSIHADSVEAHRQHLLHRLNALPPEADEDPTIGEMVARGLNS